MDDDNAKDRRGMNTARASTRRDFARLLSQHYGDGLVYLADETDRLLLKTAIDVGLVSADGHVTAAGYRLWRRVSSD